MSRHINIPVFIPHEGCPNNCVFCNQHTITGVGDKADRDISKEIDTALSTYEGTAENAEIAFFGGSFTGIDRALMVKLLDTAYRYVESGRVSAIRLSTRPDYIDREILDILLSKGVTDIELGLQSMRQSVLNASKRGHTAEDAERACALIKEYGFNLTGQMMLGLPCSDLQDELYTARKIIQMKCDCARIYPTVVFEETELCEMARLGIYTPLTIDEAVTRGTEVYAELVNSGVKILRIGLQSTEALTSGENVYAGANHSALGELIIGEYYYKLMQKDFDRICKTVSNGGDTLVIHCAEGEQSKVSGHKKKNKSRLLELLNNAGVKVRDIRIEACRNVNCNSLSYSIKE